MKRGRDWNITAFGTSVDRISSAVTTRGSINAVTFLVGDFSGCTLTDTSCCAGIQPTKVCRVNPAILEGDT